MSMNSFGWRILALLLAGLALGPLGAAAQVPAAAADYDYLPVSSALLGHFSLGPYRVAGALLGQGGSKSESSTGFGKLLFSSNFHAKRKQELTLTDTRSQQQVRVQALARLEIHTSLLENLSRAGRPGSDSLTGRNLDTYAGTLALGEQAAEAWQFTAKNPSQLGGAQLRGTLSGPGQRLITFAEVRNALNYANEGDMAAAMLAAQVPYGIVFSLDGQPIAALDLGSTSNWAGRPRQGLWLKKTLDPALQLVVASMASALLTRPNLK